VPTGDEWFLSRITQSGKAKDGQTLSLVDIRPICGVWHSEAFHVKLNNPLLAASCVSLPVQSLLTFNDFKGPALLGAERKHPLTN
jgi:hypothetical protein